MIREQTLDQKSFIVTNLRTDSQEKVPSQLIKFGELSRHRISGGGGVDTVTGAQC